MGCEHEPRPGALPPITLCEACGSEVRRQVPAAARVAPVAGGSGEQEPHSVM